MAPFDMVLFGIEVAILVGLSLAMLVPFVSHRRNVLYGEGVLSLVAALLLLTAGAVIEYVYRLGRPSSWLVVAYGLYVLGSAAIVVSMWFFAREFVQPTDEQTVDDRDCDDVGRLEDVGGFEDVGRLEDVGGVEDVGRLEDVGGVEDVGGLEDVGGVEDVGRLEDVGGVEDVGGSDDV